MIAKLTTGNGFSGALRYDLREGQLVEKKGAVPETVRVLDAKDVCFDYDEAGNMVLDVKQVAWDFRQQTMAYGGRNPIEKPVYHWALAYHPDDQVSDEQMLKDTEEFLDKMGFGNTQYVVIAHHDTDHPHVHVIANIVDNDAMRIPTYKMIEKAHKVAADITKKKGYIWGKKASKQTVENAHKPHEKVRMIIESVIKSAVLESVSFDQLQTKLIKKGISCQIKEASDGKRGGISFGCKYKGQQHTFSGSSVDRQLSFGRIKQTFEFNKNSLLYIVHSRTNASVYSLDTNYSYKDMEPLRQALVERGYMVAGIQGKDEFDREIELLKKGKADFRVGHITRHDNKISFNKETIVGNPAVTEPAFAQTVHTSVPQPRVKTMKELAKLKNVSTDKQSTKEAINKSELNDNEKKPGIKI